LARSVLIVKLAAIGDVVMALPMITALRAAEPGVRIAWMCGRGVAPLLGSVEGIDELIVVDEAALLAGAPLAKLRSGLAAVRVVAGRRFDDVYVAHSDRRYRRLVASVRASRRHWLGGSPGRRPMLPGRMHSDEYVRLVTGLDDFRAPQLPPPAVRVEMPAALDRELSAFNAGGLPLVALAPGGARNVARDNPLRRWPIERYRQLVALLHAQGYATVLAGDAGDDWVRAPLAGLGSLDLVGRTDLPVLVALFRRCAAVVTHDSGPMHLARLAPTRVVALFGPTPPSAFFRPSPSAAVLWPGIALACAPCYDGREFAACTNNQCMQFIEPAEVLARVLALAPPGNAATVSLEGRLAPVPKTPSP
jgi:heptosyltransferase-2